MGRMRAEDSAAFAEWYGASAARVRRAVTLAVGDAGLAEEATAEAYARALVHWRRSARRPGRTPGSTGSRSTTSAAGCGG